jgi:hypothetical protein
MAAPASKSQDPVTWVRTVNRRWLVHHGLKESAEAYLDHLELKDSSRLVASCARARQLVRKCCGTEDRKPWFYAGLFSLAAPDEASQFLEGHWFTAASVPLLPAAFAARMQPDHVGPETRAKLKQIRKCVARLSSNPD